MSTPNTIKVFAGNLPFSTNDEQLKAMFAPAGNVVSATVIFRGARSLGYGFVEMDNEASAMKAVDLMNKTTVDNRQINVEIARPRASGEGAARTGAAGGAGAAGADGASRGRRRNRGRGRAPRAGGEGAEGAAAGQQGRAPAAPRADRVQSQTTCFVANLPFNVDSETLLKEFKAAKAVDAHVATRRAGRSKGFGFVLFANSADQQKAIASMDNKTIEGRVIAVKAAMTEFAAEKQRAEQQASRPAPAAGATPAAAAPAATASTSAAAAPRTASGSAAAPAAATTRPAASPAKK